MFSERKYLILRSKREAVERELGVSRSNINDAVAFGDVSSISMEDTIRIPAASSSAVSNQPSVSPFVESSAEDPGQAAPAASTVRATVFCLRRALYVGDRWNRLR